MRELPSGTVTFLFTDIEGSTRLLHELGAEGYADALAAHQRVLREAFAAHGGVEVDTQGDAFLVAFARATDAAAAAAEAQHALEPTGLRVRMGLHTGEPAVTKAGYVGVDVHVGARVMNAGHGGQVLLSETTRLLVDGDARDLGKHRLKDLAEPLRLYQLGDGSFPPLKTLNNSEVPLPATPLVGRKQELADLLRLVQREHARVATVTGPGGIGKTRLALEVAAESVESFGHGVWFVDLSPLRDPSLVVPTIAATVGARHSLGEHIADKELLLVLDNFEQVAGAAPPLAAVLAACPSLQLLVTSREPLHIAGEREYPLRPIPEVPAVELFRQRAEAVRPDFDADYDQLAAICGRLDGLPLAIELAAARVKALDVETLAARLDQRLPLLTGGSRDAAARQQTLRATIEWSYDLLDEEEQRVFRELAVFAGGCTLEAAEEVAGAGLETISSLVDKSLLRHEGARYSMLETMREYALEQLGGDAAALEARIALWVDAVAAGARDRFRSADTGAIKRTVEEIDNVVGAIDWAVEHDRVLALRLLHEMGFALGDRGLMPRVRTWLERIYRPDDPLEVRLRALEELVLANRHEHATVARRYADEWVAAAHETGEVAAIVNALHGAGLAALASYGPDADLESARRRLRAAVEIARDAGGGGLLAHPLSSLGIAEGLAHEYDAAAHHLEEAAAIFAEVGRISNRAICLQELADVEAHRGARTRAGPALREALEIHLRTQSRGGVAICLDIGALLAAADDPDLAARLLGAADALVEEVGALLRNVGGTADEAAAVAAQALGDRFDAVRGEGRLLGDEHAVAALRAYVDSP